MSEEMERLDCVVVGAGCAGLAAAKALHQLHPDYRLAILEASSTVGGVWATHRLYPGLKSNNLVGTYEYPDFPMDPAVFDVKPGQHIPGIVLYKYLTSYAEHFGIAGSVRCGCRVVAAEHQEPAGWVLTVVKTTDDAGDSEGAETQLFTRKMIVATGLTSQPFLPHFEGQETFGVPLFHGKDFQKKATLLESAKSVTVFGGTKTAWDVIYECGTRGIKVNWVIRATGHGPTWMSPPYVTPLKKWLEKLVNTRVLTWFSPCVWGDADGYTGIRYFYHSTAMGRFITNLFWSILGNDVLTLNKYDAHPETAKLKPWSQAMFVASSFSILNYPTDFFDLVRNGTVKVHIGDPVRLSPGTVHLGDGTELHTDALCCVTGWRHVPPLKFLPEGIEKEIGVPVPYETGADTAPSNDSSLSKPIFTPDLVARADEEIFARFPRLRDQPVQNARLRPLVATQGVSTDDPLLKESAPQLTPYTLLRFIAPPSPRLLAARDLAFAGAVMSFSTSLVAHMQSLWIDAFFEGKLPQTLVPASLQSGGHDAMESGIGNKLHAESPEEAAAMEQLRYQTVLHARFGKWRYPASYGARYPDFVFDAVPYLDLLLKDLELQAHRKGGWWSEATQPYGPEDYRGTMAEWMAKSRSL